MSRGLLRVLILAGALVVSGCGEKPEHRVGSSWPAAEELKSDKTFGPAITAVADATPDVERIAALTLLQVALGKMSAGEAQARFDATVESYLSGTQSSSVIAAALSADSDAYVALAVQKAQTTTLWPADHERNAWIGIAAIELQLARNEIAAAREPDASPVQGLHRVNLVLALADGQHGVTPESDEFAGYDSLVERGVARLAHLRQPQRPPS